MIVGDGGVMAEELEGRPLDDVDPNNVVDDGLTPFVCVENVDPVGDRPITRIKN